MVYETLTFMPGDRASATDICHGIQTDSYYSMDDQVIEDDAKPTGCGGTTTTSTYVWGMDYVNDLIERDSSSGTSRIYVEHDANWDVTSLVSAGSTPTVLERFVYDPYGNRTVLNATTWALQSDTQSWIYSFQGGRLDTISGLIHFQARDLNTSLGRWMQEDPAGYVDGANLYQAEGSHPVGSVDPLGEFLVDLTFDAFIPMSHGVQAPGSYDFNWGVAPHLLPSVRPEIEQWDWFETDNRENPGEPGTSRLRTDVYLAK